MLAYLFLIIGLANPQVGTKEVERKRQGIDLVIALDVSNSMKAQDIKPSRLERAKQLIYNLLDTLQDDRIGLIIFAGVPDALTPLTNDKDAVKIFLESVDTDIISQQGTSLTQAIELAMRMMSLKEEEQADKKTNREKLMLIISDGEDHDEGAVQKAKEASENGFIIHTIGMGSTNGAPIPVFRDGQQIGYLTDEFGSIVITKMNSELMQEIANVGNGKFISANQSGFVSINPIVEQIEKMQKQEFQAMKFKEWDNHFQYFLGIALFVLFIELMLSEKRIKSNYLSKLLGISRQQ
jgi:Ca-activated chloride channel family protein